MVVELVWRCEIEEDLENLGIGAWQPLAPPEIDLPALLLPSGVHFTQSSVLVNSLVFSERLNHSLCLLSLEKPDFLELLKKTCKADMQPPETANLDWSCESMGCIWTTSHLHISQDQGHDRSGARDSFACPTGMERRYRYVVLRMREYRL
jgi:hypothetical protein